MLRSRFALASAASALLFGCSHDTTTTPTNNIAFEGVSWVAPDETGKLVVSWKPAPDAVEYRVYVSRIQGREQKTTPAARTAGTSVTVTTDVSGEKYFVLVRAADARGLEDKNNVERSAVASPDTVAPTFTGPRLVEPAGSAGARVTWDAAKDDLTPPEAIVYDVYVGRTRTAIRKIATTGPGETTITLNQLGSPSETLIFAVRARDIANNESAESQPIMAALGQDATMPVFGGCDTAMSLGPTSAEITWSPASDNFSPASSLTYDVYLSTTSHTQDFAAPSAAKLVAGTSTKLTGLKPGGQYFVVCKVHDVAGNIDGNTTERSFTTAGDVTKPTFAGITTYDFDPVHHSVTLHWTAGTDNETQPPALVYDVFESLVPGTYAFTAPPRATSAPGATSIVIGDLATRSALNWVVRARDATGNRDDNLIEKSGTTLTSFAIDVQGVFNRNCAVVGCHVTGPQTGGLNLSPAFSYGSLYNAPSNQNRPSVRVSPNKDLLASWLYLKITDPMNKGGLLMPAPQTGNALSVVEKDIITSWILEGALNN